MVATATWVLDIEAWDNRYLHQPHDNSTTHTAHDKRNATHSQMCHNRPTPKNIPLQEQTTQTGMGVENYRRKDACVDIVGRAETSPSLCQIQTSRQSVTANCTSWELSMTTYGRAFWLSVCYQVTSDRLYWFMPKAVILHFCAGPGLGALHLGLTFTINTMYTDITLLSSFEIRVLKVF